MSVQEPRPVTVPAHGAELDGILARPDGDGGLVVFVHGSGSSRTSPRNTFVARTLRERGLGYLLFDLLTEAEDRDRRARFDLDLLTRRLLDATAWLEGEPTVSGSVGYFGSSTGAAAALIAAATHPSAVEAVVSRGGRVDLAADRLAAVRAPTLLLVGGADTQVLQLNRSAYDRLTCEKRIDVIEGAGHLFEAPGELERVATLAGEWFQTHLR